jgi:hypothetical protein
MKYLLPPRFKITNRSTNGDVQTTIEGSTVRFQSRGLGIPLGRYGYLAFLALTEDQDYN